MAAFTDGQIDWSRIEVQAIVGHHGLAVIEIGRRVVCQEWVRQHGYRLDQLDCTVGLDAFIGRFGTMFRWEEQFGYQLVHGSRNLDALRDGFEVDVPAGDGVVLELFQPDLIWREDSRWLLGLLAIASEHSRYHLAC